MGNICFTGRLLGSACEMARELKLKVNKIINFIRFGAGLSVLIFGLAVSVWAAPVITVSSTLPVTGSAIAFSQTITVNFSLSSTCVNDTGVTNSICLDQTQTRVSFNRFISTSLGSSQNFVEIVTSSIQWISTTNAVGRFSIKPKTGELWPVGQLTLSSWKILTATPSGTVTQSAGPVVGTWSIEPILTVTASPLVLIDKDLLPLTVNVDIGLCVNPSVSPNLNQSCINYSAATTGLTLHTTNGTGFDFSSNMTVSNINWTDLLNGVGYFTITPTAKFPTGNLSINDFILNITPGFTGVTANYAVLGSGLPVWTVDPPHPTFTVTQSTLLNFTGTGVRIVTDYFVAFDITATTLSAILTTPDVSIINSANQTVTFNPGLIAFNTLFVTTGQQVSITAPSVNGVLNYAQPYRLAVTINYITEEGYTGTFAGEVVTFNTQPMPPDLSFYAITSTILTGNRLSTYLPLTWVFKSTNGVPIISPNNQLSVEVAFPTANSIVFADTVISSNDTIEINISAPSGGWPAGSIYSKVTFTNLTYQVSDNANYVFENFLDPSLVLYTPPSPTWSIVLTDLYPQAGSVNVKTKTDIYFKFLVTEATLNAIAGTANIFFYVEGDDTALRQASSINAQIVSQSGQQYIEVRASADSLAEGSIYKYWVTVPVQTTEFVGTLLSSQGQATFKTRYPVPQFVLNTNPNLLKPTRVPAKPGDDVQWVFDIPGPEQPQISFDEIKIYFSPFALPLLQPGATASVTYDTRRVTVNISHPLSGWGDTEYTGVITLVGLHYSDNGALTVTQDIVLTSNYMTRVFDGATADKLTESGLSGGRNLLLASSFGNIYNGTLVGVPEVLTFKIDELDQTLDYVPMLRLTNINYLLYPGMMGYRDILVQETNQFSPYAKLITANMVSGRVNSKLAGYMLPTDTFSFFLYTPEINGAYPPIATTGLNFSMHYSQSDAFIADFPLVVNGICLAPPAGYYFNCAPGGTPNYVTGKGFMFTLERATPYQRGEIVSFNIASIYQYDGVTYDYGIKQIKYQVIGSPYLDEWMTITTNVNQNQITALQKVGDLNGDGFADLAYSEFSETSSNGRVIIFYGGPAMDNKPDVIIQGDNPRFGTGLAGAVDFNGDGISDLVIGDPFYSAQSQTAKGRILLYLGRKTFSAQTETAVSLTPEELITIIEGQTSEEFMGLNVASGYLGSDRTTPEVVVVSSQDVKVILNIDLTQLPVLNTDVNKVKRVVTQGYDRQVVVKIIPSIRDKEFYNGKRINDLAVGLPRESVGGFTGAGQVRVFSGTAINAGEDPAAFVQETGSGAGKLWIYNSGLNQANQYFGGSIEVAGDVDGIGSIQGGAGFDDLLVGPGSLGNVFGIADRDVYLILGGPLDQSQFPSHRININRIDFANKNDLFGAALAGGHDIDGPDVPGAQFKDFVIGAPNANGGAGGFYTYLGGNYFDTQFDFDNFALDNKVHVIHGANVGDHLGSFVSLLGDMDGDGYAELAVGAPGAGQIKIYRNRNNNDFTPPVLVDFKYVQDQTGVPVNPTFVFKVFDQGYKGLNINTLTLRMYLLAENVPDSAKEILIQNGQPSVGSITNFQKTCTDYTETVVACDSAVPIRDVELRFKPTVALKEGRRYTIDFRVLDKAFYNNGLEFVNGNEMIVTYNFQTTLAKYKEFLGTPNNNVGPSTTVLPVTASYTQNLVNVGDFNGDGFDDFVLSNDGSLIINNLKSEILSKVITTQLPFGSIEGRYVLLYLGGQLFDLKNPDAIIFKHNRSRDRNSQFGKAVAGADLIGNDGRNDLIISDPAIHDQPFERSEVYVIRGRSFPTGQRPFVIWMNGGEGQIAASAVSDQLISVPIGAAKTLISNFNFDQDVGNYKEIAFSLANGGVVMLKGSPTGFENLPEYQYFTGSDNSFGTALAASQIDATHSGDDLLIGEPASGNGQVYLVKSSASGWLTNYNSGTLGSPTLMNVTNLFAKGQYLGDQFGYSIAVNGKMNSNSLMNTVAIGAPQNSIAGPKAGRVYLYAGTTPLTNPARPLYSFSGEQVSENFGYSLAFSRFGVELKDNLNFDTYIDANDDLVVGAPGYTDFVSGENRGRIYILYGSEQFNTKIDAGFTGTDANGRLGKKVIGLGFFKGLRDDANPTNKLGEVAVIGDKTANHPEGLLYILKNLEVPDKIAPDFIVLSPLNFSYDVSVTAPIRIKIVDESGIKPGSLGVVRLVDGESLTYVSNGNLNSQYANKVAVSLNVVPSTNNQEWILEVFPRATNTQLVPNAWEKGENVLLSISIKDDAFKIIDGKLFEGGTVANFDYGMVAQFPTLVNFQNSLLIGGYYNGSTFTEDRYPNTQYGFSMAYVGDVNGDGRPDFMVGEPQRGGPGNTGLDINAGRTYLYLGNGHGYGVSGNTGAESLVYPNLTLEFEHGYPAAKFGYKIASAGDFNNDGFGDVIISALNSSGLAGEVFVLFGNPDPQTPVNVDGKVPWNSEYLHREAISIMGENPGDGFGLQIAGAGDINGDGYSDIVIGAPNYNNGKGRVYVVFGRKFATGLQNAYYSRPYPDGSVGPHGPIRVGRGLVPVTTAGLFTFDPNIVVTGEDIMYGFYLDPVLSGSAPLFGASLLTNTDINGDGKAEIIIGAPGDVNGKGAAQIFSMTNSFTSPVRTLNGGRQGDSFGFSLAGLADISFDGQASAPRYGDFVIGAPGFSLSDKEGVGAAYLIVNTANVANNWNAVTINVKNRMTGSNAGDRFGYSVANGGNIDNDALDNNDIIVGAPGYDLQAGDTENTEKTFLNNTGRVFVFATTYDSNKILKFNNLAVMSVKGKIKNAQYGFALSTAGDVDQDFVSEFLVGSPFYSSGNAALDLFTDLPATSSISPQNYGRVFLYQNPDRINPWINISLISPPYNTTNNAKQKFNTQLNVTENLTLRFDIEDDRLVDVQSVQAKMQGLLNYPNPPLNISPNYGPQLNFDFNNLTSTQSYFTRISRKHYQFFVKPNLDQIRFRDVMTVTFNAKDGAGNNLVGVLSGINKNEIPALPDRVTITFTIQPDPKGAPEFPLLTLRPPFAPDQLYVNTTNIGLDFFAFDFSGSITSLNIGMDPASSNILIDINNPLISIGGGTTTPLTYYTPATKLFSVNTWISTDLPVVGTVNTQWVSGSVNVVLDPGEGVKKIPISFIDQFGNQSDPLLKEVIYDIQAPQLQVLAPAINSTTALKTDKVVLQFTDLGAGFDLASMNINVVSSFGNWVATYNIVNLPPAYRPGTPTYNPQDSRITSMSIILVPPADLIQYQEGVTVSIYLPDKSAGVYPSHVLQTTFAYQISADYAKPNQAKILINGGDETSTQGVVVNLSAKDDIGVTEYMLWGDLVTPDTNWVVVPGGTAVSVNFNIGTLLSIITPNVPNVLYAQFRDAQGNTSNVVSGSIMQDFNPFGGPILVKAVVLGKSNVAITNIGKKYINTTETNIWLNAVQLSPNFVTTFNIASTGNFFDTVFPTGYSPVGGETPITADASVFHSFDTSNPLTNIKTVKFVPGEGVKSFYVLFYDDFNRPSVTKSFSVILDQTIPAIITANNVAVGYSLGATNYTAQTAKLRLRVQAGDNLSDIDHYTYTVYEIPPDQVSTPTAVQTGAIYFGQSSFPSAANNYEADFTINQTLKTQGQKYYFVVTAFDGAGNESLPITTEPMGVDSYLNFPIEPVVNYPSNIVINRPIVDVDFYDKESGISLVRIYTRTDLADTFEGNVNFTQSLIHKLRSGTIDVLQQSCTTTNTIVSVPSPNAPGGFELVNVPSTNCVSSTVSQTINFFAHGYDENWTIPSVLWDQIVEGQTVRLVFEQIDSVGNLRNRAAFTASNQEQVQFRKDITPPVIALNYVSNQFAFNTPQVTMSIQTNADTNFYLLAQNNISTASFVSDYSFEDAGYSGTRNSGWVINPLVGDNAPIAGSVTGDVVYMTGAALTSIDSLDQVARTAFGGNFGLRVRLNLPVGSPAFTYSQVTWKGVEKNIPLDAPLSTTTTYTVLLATNLTDYAPMNQRSLCLSLEQYQGVTLSSTTVVECINEVNNLWRIMGGLVTVNQGIDRLVARVSFVPTKNLYDTNPNNLYSAIDPSKPIYLDELILFKGNLIIPAKIYQNNPAQNQNKSITMNIADTDVLNAFTMTLAARDQVGNWSFATKNVYVDFTTPSMTQVLNVPYAPGINGINYAGQFTVSTSSLRIRLDASDGQSGSGIRRYWFKVVNERTGIRIYPSTSEWQGISVLDRNFPLTDIIVSTGGSTQGIPALAAPLRLDGLYRVYAYAEDYVTLTSNVVTSDTVVIDNKAPVASFVFDAPIVNQVSAGVYDYSGWYNNPNGIGITVSAIDNWIDNSGTQSVTVTGSGVTTINFVVNGGPTQSVTAVNGSVAFRLTNDGLNTFSYWAQDALGQQGVITSIKPPFVINNTITIGGKFASEYYGEFITNNAVTITANLDFGLYGFYLDTLPPTVNSNLHAFNDIWRSSSFRPVFSTDDLGDGVRNIFYQIDSEAPQTLNIDATSIGDPEPYYDHFITRANYFPYGIQNADLIVTLNLLAEDGKDILLRVRDTTTENVLVRLRGSIAGNKLTLLRVNSSVVSQSATLGGGVFSILHPNDSHLVTTLAYSYNGTSKVLTLTIPDKGLGSVYVPVYYPFRRAIDPLSAEGFHVFTYWAVDKFNHVSSPNVVPILKIDRGEPHVTIDLGSSVQGRWVTANTGIPVNLIVEDLFATAVTFNPSNYPLADQINPFVTMPAPGFPSARPGSGPTQAKIWVNTTANAMPAMTFINEDLLATGNRGQFGFYGNAIVTANGVNYLSYQAFDLAGNSNSLPVIGALNSSLVTAQVLFDVTHNTYVIYPIYTGDQGVIRDLKLDNSAPNGGSLSINKYASHASYNLLPSYTSTQTVVINLEDLRDAGIGVRYIYITGDVIDNPAPLTTFRNPSPNAAGPDQFDSSVVKPVARAFAPVNRWFELPLNKLNPTLDHDPDSVNGMVREAVLWPLRDHLNTKVYVTLTPGDGPKQIQVYTGDDFILGNPILDPALNAAQLIPADTWRVNHMALLGSKTVTYDTQVGTPQITVIGKTIDNFIGTSNIGVKIDISQLNDLSGIDAVYLDGDIGGPNARTWISYLRHPTAVGTVNFMVVTVNLNALENTKNISVKIRDRAGNMWTMLETNFASHSKNESTPVTTNVFYDTPMLCNQNIDRKITWSLDGKPNYFWFRTPTWDITIDCAGANRLVVSGDVKTYADGITVNDSFGIDFKSSNRLYLNDNVDGLKHIYFRMIDRSTQSDLSHQFVMLDRVAPVVTSNAQNISFYTDFLGAKIGITAYDPKGPSVNEVSNIKYIVYRINNDVPQTINFDSVPIPAGTSVTVSVTINITSEGINNTLRYYAVDKAGNTAPEIVISGIKVNRTPPVGQYVRSLTGKLFNNVYYTNSNRVTLDILAFDTDIMDISGNVVGAPYQVAYASKKEITLTPGEGTKNISITFRDQFFADPNTFNIQIVYDTTAPAAPQITSQVPTLSSVAAAIVTGNIEAYASIISSQLVTSNMLTPTSYRAVFKLLPGSNLISFSARDLAGNLSAATQMTVTLNPLAWVETGSGDLPVGVADVSITQVPSSQPQVMIANQYQAQTNPGAQSYLSDTIRDFNLIASMGYDAQSLVNIFAQEEISIVIPFSSQAAAQGKPKQFRIFYLNPATNRWELVPGDQVVDLATKTVKTRVSHFSTYAILELTPASVDNGLAQVFPNPFIAGDGDANNGEFGAGQGVFFDNMTAGADIKIYTISGALVKKLTATGSGDALWDVRNEAGEQVASGIYLYSIVGSNTKKVGRITVVRK